MATIKAQGCLQALCFYFTIGQQKLLNMVIQLSDQCPIELIFTNRLWAPINQVLPDDFYDSRPNSKRFSWLISTRFSWTLNTNVPANFTKVLPSNFNKTLPANFSHVLPANFKKVLPAKLNKIFLTNFNNSFPVQFQLFFSLPILTTKKHSINVTSISFKFGSGQIR